MSSLEHMRYCSNCGAEYRDEATKCSDCPGARLVSADELRSLGITPITEVDHRRFVRVVQVDDPLTAQRLTRLLEEARIPVIVRDPRGGTVDFLTTGISQDWWELSVPRAKVDAARRVLASVHPASKAERAELEKEAEREALEAPPPTPN